MASKQLILTGPVAVFFFGMGLIALIDPPSVVGLFSPPDFGADMRNEIRAVYGGFGLAICGLLIATFYKPTIAEGARLAVAVALGGMAAGRVISLLIEPADTLWPVATIAAESAMAAMLIAARR